MRKIIASSILLLTSIAEFSAFAATADNLEELEKAKTTMTTNLDLAEDYITKALKKAPLSAETYFVCGRIMGMQAEAAIFSALSYAKKSLSCLERAVTLQPDNTTYRKGLMYFYLGAPGIAGGDSQLAWQQAEQIAEIDNYQGILAKLSYFRETEQSEQYQQLLDSSRQTFPEHAELHYRFGLALQSEKQYADAMLSFFKATEAGIDEDEIYSLNAFYQIGRTALFGSQRLDDGIQALLFYLSQAPDSPLMPDKHWAHFRLAQLYEQAGDEHKMQHHLNMAQQSNDKELLREIRKLLR